MPTPPVDPSNAVARRLGFRDGHREWDADDAVWEVVWTAPPPTTAPAPGRATRA